MDLNISSAFGAIVEELHKDPSNIGAVVITGKGRAFSAGGDLAWLHRRTLDSSSRNSFIMRDFCKWNAMQTWPCYIVH